MLEVVAQYDAVVIVVGGGDGVGDDSVEAAGVDSGLSL